ncbi:MAG: hypothetical protein ACRER2_17435 [Methylococcales bacterium]
MFDWLIAPAGLGFSLYRQGNAVPARRGFKVKTSNPYHKWVEWSEEDQAYLGKCPDLITGIQGDDPVQVYCALCEVVEDIIRHFESESRPLPMPKVRPMQEVA